MKSALAVQTAIDVPTAGRHSGWRQFEKPSGLGGRIAGYVMAVTNKERSWFVLPLLDIRQNDRLLEIGFGSGIDIRRVSEMTIEGLVAGIDHSEVMVTQARKRNAAAIRAGRVKLDHGPSAPLPYPDSTFDKAFSINVAQFWSSPVEVLSEIRRVLRPGGLAAIAVQPRSKNVTAREIGQKLLEAMRAAGFTETRLEFKKMKPAATVCALGVKPTG